MGDAGRRDYNASLRFRQIKAGEPMFIILGRDAVSGDTVRDWASRAFDAGAPVALVESALQQADAMDAYAEKHVPDADHLSDGEARQLAFQFDRRCWNARPNLHPVAKSNEVMFAERRGYALAEARLRLAQRFLVDLHAAARAALEVYPAGDAASELARVIAAAGAHLSSIGDDKEAVHG